MKKVKKVKKVEDDFNIDDWVNLERKHAQRRVLFNDQQIVFTARKKKGKEDIMVLSFSFRKKIISLLGCQKENKVLVLTNKQHADRVLLTRSPNGYAIFQPDKNRDYYILQCTIDNNGTIPVQKIIIDPVFHPKGGNSGSMIELRLNIDNED